MRKVPAVGVTESEKGERILVGVTDPVAGAAMANLREGEEAKRVKRKEVNRVVADTRGDGSGGKKQGK